MKRPALFGKLKKEYPLTQTLSQQGITLIELLVVISVIGVLSGVMFIMLDPVELQGKARDSQRKTHMKQIQTSLELYYKDYQGYPSSIWENIDGTSTLETAIGSGKYIDAVPHDPISSGANSGPCSTPTAYRYNYISDGSSYYLTATMEVESSNSDSACEDLVDWDPTWCVPFNNADTCYGVRSP